MPLLPPLPSSRVPRLACHGRRILPISKLLKLFFYLKSRGRILSKEYRSDASRVTGEHSEASKVSERSNASSVGEHSEASKKYSQGG